MKCKLITVGELFQFDPRGRNFLHIAIQKSDIESVLFLLSVHANVNSCVQDSARLSPLHIAVKVGAEIIVRNLVSSYTQTVIGIPAAGWYCCFSCWVVLLFNLLGGIAVLSAGWYCCLICWMVLLFNLLGGIAV